MLQVVTDAVRTRFRQLGAVSSDVQLVEVDQAAEVDQAVKAEPTIPTADLEEKLTAVKGVGPALAKKIMEAVFG